jgi:hypothetical protein
MKKVFGIIAITAISLSANAQIKTNAGTFAKPTVGSWLVQVTFTPDLGGGGSIFNLPNFGSTENPLTGFTARKFTSESKAIRYSAALDIKNSGEKDAPTTFGVAVGLGIENHMKGAERLSTYWGYGGMIGYGKDVLKSTTIGVKAQLFTGFDYYIVPNVYLGAEITYGLGISSVKPEGGDSKTAWGLTSGINPGFRLGWKF